MLSFTLTAVAQLMQSHFILLPLVLHQIVDLLWDCEHDHERIPNRVFSLFWFDKLRNWKNPTQVCASVRSLKKLWSLLAATFETCSHYYYRASLASKRIRNTMECIKVVQKVVLVFLKCVRLIYHLSSFVIGNDKEQVVWPYKAMRLMPSHIQFIYQNTSTGPLAIATAHVLRHAKGWISYGCHLKCYYTGCKFNVNWSKKQLKDTVVLTASCNLDFTPRHYNSHIIAAVVTYKQNLRS